MKWSAMGFLLIVLWGPALSPLRGEVFYYHTDHLGSVRLITNSQRSVVALHDYLPFGEDVVAAENNRLKFTGKYRDETEYDYFGARYYAGPLGRFFSVDIGRPNPVEPQTWNRYVYVTNNPLRFDDPDGRLKRDKSGKLIFEKKGEVYVRHVGAPDVLFHVETGYLLADNDTKIEAYRSLDKEDARFKCDCHGLTFADGHFWINDQEVKSLLKGDKYIKTDKPQVGDIGIYRDASGAVKHSVTVASVDKKGRVVKVSGLGGIELEAHSDKPEPGPGGGWYDPKATIEYWHKADDTRNEAKRRQDAEKVLRYKKTIP